MLWNFSFNINAQDFEEELDALEGAPSDDFEEFEDFVDEDAIVNDGEDLEEIFEDDSDDEFFDDGSDPGVIEGDFDDQDFEDDLEIIDDTGGNIDDDIGLEAFPEEESPIPVVSAGTLMALDFKQLNDRVRLIVTADRSINWTRIDRIKRKQVIFVLRNTVISKDILRHAFDTGEFDGPVALIQSYEARSSGASDVKVLFQLRHNAIPTVLGAGNRIYIDFPISSEKNVIRSRSLAQPELPRTFLSINDQMEFKGKRISLNVKDLELTEVLNFLSRETGKNFIFGGKGNAKVTMNVKDSPWDQVFSIILLNNKLGYQQIGETYRILPISDISAEIQQAQAAAKQIEELAPLDTKLISLNYAQATAVQSNLNDFKSTRGKISVDSRSNTLVITDTVEALAKMEQYVRSIDKQNPQVLIEARIVEATDDFTEAFDIAWRVGHDLDATNRFAGTHGTVSGTPGEEIGDSTGRFKFQVANLGAFGTVSAALGLLETQKKVKNIASPRIAVINNTAANIQQGTQFSVPISGPDGSQSLQQVSATLNLQVTPQVANDGFVFLNINLQQNSPQGTGAGGVPPINTQSATTQLLVESGKTAAIGGIYTETRSKDVEKLPILGQLPVLGKVFFHKKLAEQIGKKELLMFISPRILNEDKTQIVRHSLRPDLEVDDEEALDEELEELDIEEI